jgi:hypothetical protein
MRVKIKGKTAGPVPSEAVVTIPTTAGSEEVVVHTSQVNEAGMEVGFIGRKDHDVLIELPRESVSGRWRVWVPESELA